MTTYTEIAVTGFNSPAIADQINALYAENPEIEVAGSKVTTHYLRRVANSYGNGTVGIVTPARTPGKVNERFFKVGSTIFVKH